MYHIKIFGKSTFLSGGFVFMVDWKLSNIKTTLSRVVFNKYLLMTILASDFNGFLSGRIIF